MDQLIFDSAEKIFADFCDKALLDAAETGEFAQSLWQAVVTNGFHQLGSADTGTNLQDMYGFMQLCGRFAVPLPLADTLLANLWLPASNQLTAIGLWEDAHITNVVWGQSVSRVIGVRANSPEVVVVEAPEVAEVGTSITGEPMAQIAVDASAQRINVTEDPYAHMALSRLNLMAGGLQTLLELGLQFANERVQFGRAISKFQVIQHILAVVAAEVAAARRAADAAVDAAGSDRFIEEVAAAKARVGEAVGVVAEQIHQVHGAMGFTHEHRLHHFSRRCWAWRDEWGNEFEWQQRLGQHIAQLGADQVWHYIATNG